MVRKQHLCDAIFILENDDHFTKTGSGQMEGNALSQRGGNDVFSGENGLWLPKTSLKVGFEPAYRDAADM
jgi:hypothetical protein